MLKFKVEFLLLPSNVIVKEIIYADSLEQAEQIAKKLYPKAKIVCMIGGAAS